MHIWNGHIQKTQPPHTAKQWREKEGMNNKIINFKWWFKPGSRVHQPHTRPNRFSYEQTSTICLDESAPTHPSAQQWCLQNATNIKHKQLIELSSKKVKR
jgi:hypothetical protein